MSKTKLFSLIFMLCIVFCPRVRKTAYAFDNETVVYTVVQNGNVLMQRQNVQVDDEVLTKDFKKYRIDRVDKQNKIAYAEWLCDVEKPAVDFGFSFRQTSEQKPVVALYMTHNDESYVPTDNTESVYGAGGIHDVANALRTNLENEGVTTYIDETLHIPHDTSAYSRSQKTAKNMIEKYNPDCIFDIHRDGASRSTYVKKVDGVERCKVRIVVGKSSPNFEIAEQVALYLMSIADEVCDWLFLDVYYAKGHYNQGLHNKALLFEMGSHLVEKPLVLSTTQNLAKVINLAFFNTTIDSDTGDATIFGSADSNNQYASDYFDTISESKQNNGIIAPLLFLIFVSGISFGIMYCVIHVVDKKQKSLTKK